MGALNIHTQSLQNESITIVAANNVLRVSVLAKQGVVVVNGSQSFQGNPSTALSFVAGQGITISSSSAQNPIDGLTITAATISDVGDIVVSTQ
jgi:hypothetical protein